MSEGADHLAEVTRRIAQSAKAAGRDPGAVTLVAVSKTHGADKVRELLVAGQRVFGENRVQEAEEKFPALKAEYPDLQLHLIGPLQTNKAREAVALFDVIESVDRERLAVTLAKEMARANRRAVEGAARGDAGWADVARLVGLALVEQARPRRTLDARRRAARGAVWARVARR